MSDVPYYRLKRAAFIAQAVMGKQTSLEDPLAYWTLINTLLEFATEAPSRLPIRRASTPPPEKER